MVESKDCKAIDMVFRFIAASIYKATDCVEQAFLTTLHAAQLNLLCALMFDESAVVDTSG